jgi:signal transduction histidine kinase
MRLIIIFIILIINTQVSTQSPIDSLLQRCEKANDIQKIDIYLQLSKLTIKDSALSNSYNKRAFQLAVANKLIAEQAKSIYQSGKILYTARNFTDAIPQYRKALELYGQLNDTVGMTTCYRYIGISNFNLSKSKEAIASYLEGLKLAKRDLDYTAEQLGNIGLVHNEMDNMNEAISYFRQALSINQSIRDTGSMAIDYDYLGATYSRMKMPDSALVNYYKALHFFRKIRKDDRYAISLSNMAWILPNYPDSLNKAISYFNQAWEKFKDLGWVHYEANIQFGIANILSKQGKIDESIQAYKKSIQLANQYKRELFLKKQIYQGLSEVYQKKGDYKNALDYQILCSQYKDSITEKQKLDQIANLEKQYETEKKENEIIRLQAKQELTSVQLAKNKELKQLAFITVCLLLVFVFFVLFRYFDKIKVNRELEEKNRQIEKSENELRNINAAKNKFFSIIAHDLKNPLHTIMGYSDLLSKDYELFTDEERRKFAGDINQSTNSLFRLLQNLLEWSKAKTGNLKPKPMELELKRIIDNSMGILRSMAENKRLSILSNIDADLKLYSDPLMIETVIRNLVNNAIKFTPENGRIEISAFKQDNNIKISIKDTGVGLTEDELQNLFKIDSKVKRKGTNQEDGSGLGLILCQEFVEMNSGSLSVISNPGKGSTFIITLPAREGAILEEELQTKQQASA